MKHNLLLYRMEDLRVGTCVFVTFETEDSIDTEAKLLKCVYDGVTKWAETEEDGKQTYEYAGDDMNIGDLSNCDWLKIIPFCKGLRRVVFHAITVPKNWTYDTSLCGSLDLEEPAHYDDDDAEGGAA